MNIFAALDMFSSPAKRARPRFPSSSSAAGSHSSSDTKLAQPRQAQRLTPIWISLVFFILLLFLVLPGGEPVQTRAVHLTEGTVDYVGLVARPSCINQFVIKKLLENQRPKRIFLIVPDKEACWEFLGGISPSVKCIQEDSLVQDITKASVTKTLESSYPHLQGDEYLKGRTLSGWYLQQLLKLAVLQAIPDLSDPYVIWDMDMIPARQIPLVYLPSPHITVIGASDSLQLPQGASVMSVHGQPVRTVVNIGGAWSPGYGLSYEKLLHREPTFAEDGSSFVTHWIVVQKALMQSFLDALCPAFGYAKAADGCKWYDNILQNLPESDMSQGFSEYHSYISFVKQNWPQTQYEMSKRTWRRQPLGGKFGVKLARMGTAGGLCCPTSWQHSLQGMAGFDYYGLEAGHHPACRWKDAEFHRFYGPQ